MPTTAKKDTAEILHFEGPAGPRTVRVTNPEKLYFSQQIQLTKLDLVRYYLSVAPGAHAEPFYQKRAPDPKSRPDWLRAVTLSFPSGRTAEEVVVDDPAGLAWIVNLGCIELHPHPVRSGDLDHHDEIRVDLDPGPGVTFLSHSTTLE